MGKLIRYDSVSMMIIADKNILEKIGMTWLFSEYSSYTAIFPLCFNYMLWI